MLIGYMTRMTVERSVSQTEQENRASPACSIIPCHTLHGVQILLQEIKGVKQKANGSFD